MIEVDRSIKLLITGMICLITMACNKENKSTLWPAKFTCEVDGITYKDQTPYILPPGAKRTPSFNYHFDDLQKGMYFSSRLALVNQGQSEVGGYAIMIDIPLKDPLAINKEYQFVGMAGEEHNMPINYLFKYREKGLAYCHVYANGEMNKNSFGTGKLIIQSFDLEKSQVVGQIEFLVPSPVSEDAHKRLSFKGQFDTGINQN
jgi:hypothetical protein